MNILNELKQKRTWVITGVAGFIGSNLANYLISKNQKVIGVDNFITGSKKNIKLFEKEKNFKFFKADILNEKVCEKICKGADIILHQAALGSIPRSIKSPIKSNLINVNGFLNMLFYAQKNRVDKFIYASSSSVYGDSKILPKQENNLGNLLSPYAATKKINEIYSEIFKRVYGYDSIGLRYFNVFGKNQNPNGAYAAVIPKWLDSIEKNKVIEIYGSGKTTRDFCYIQNVVNANILCALQPKKKIKHNVYNVACGSKISLKDLLNVIIRIYADCGIIYKKKPIYLPFRPGDIYKSQADISFAKKDLDYNPFYGVKTGLSELIRLRLKLL